LERDAGGGIMGVIEFRVPGLGFWEPDFGFKLALKGSNIGFNWVQIGFFWL
jgi:hypothetical protein